MEKGITKKDGVTNLANQLSSGLGMEGIDGFDVSDLRMPFVKLVHPTSQNIELADGKKAQPGQWYHTTKKEAKDSLSVVFIHSKKVTVENPQNPGEMLDGVRIIALDLDDLESPIAMQFTKGGYWAYKNLLSTMYSWKVTQPWKRIVLLDSKTVETTNEKGVKNSFLVPTMNLSDELDKKQLEIVTSMVERFKGGVPEDKSEEVDLSEIPF